jgi:hypothetical protein
VTKTRCFWALCLMLGALVAVQGLAMSDDRPAKTADKVEKPNEQAVEELGQIDLAHGLIEYGRTHKSPEALVVAARMLAKFPLGQKKANGKDTTKEEQAEGSEKLLDEAAKMRSADKLMGELVNRARADIKEGSRALTITIPLYRIVYSAWPVKKNDYGDAVLNYKANKKITIFTKGGDATLTVTKTGTNTVVASGTNSVTFTTPASHDYLIYWKATKKSNAFAVYSKQ